MTLVPLHRIEKLASFLPSHLAGNTLIIRRPLIIAGTLLLAGLGRRRRLTGSLRWLAAF
jgi:hypothetical protein